MPQRGSLWGRGQSVSPSVFCGLLRHARRSHSLNHRLEDGVVHALAHEIEIILISGKGFDTQLVRIVAIQLADVSESPLARMVDIVNRLVRNPVILDDQIPAALAKGVFVFDRGAQKAKAERGEPWTNTTDTDAHSPCQVVSVRVSSFCRSEQFPQPALNRVPMGASPVDAATGRALFEITLSAENILRHERLDRSS